MELPIKRCSSCKLELPSDRFHKRAKDCKPCVSKRGKRWYAELSPERRKRRGREGRVRIYGLTLDGYNALFEAQGGRCAICRRAEVQGQSLSVDHDHSTGRVRGLLCRGCNVSLGRFNDQPALLRAAADYLDRSR